MLPNNENRELARNNALRMLKMRHMEIVLFNELIKCPDCGVTGEIRNGAITFIWFKTHKDFLRHGGDLCPIHQPKVSAYKREFCESGWWD
jgi:hypothetical protein